MMSYILSFLCFQRTPGLIDYDFVTQKTSPYNYFTFGAAVTEVEIDVLTGDHKVSLLIFALED